MDRRAFLGTLAGGLLAAPLAAEAQPQVQVARIGVISSGSPATSGPFLDAFRQRLRELGYAEGRNVTIESRYAAAQSGRFHGLATELVALGVDVIVVSGTLAARAAKEVTSSVPIVMVSVGDAVGAGLVKSLPKPGANITGQSFMGSDWPSRGSTCSQKPSRGHHAWQCSSTPRSPRRPQLSVPSMRRLRREAWRSSQ